MSGWGRRVGGDTGAYFEKNHPFLPEAKEIESATAAVLCMDSPKEHE
jgi:hypothetical protein